MPFYEYECINCGNQLEILQKISDPPITKCDQCNSQMKKIISQSTFHLKGTGWYVTDYASKNPGSEAIKSDTESSSAPKETKKEGTTTQKKEVSAPKKEAKAND